MDQPLSTRKGKGPTADGGSARALPDCRDWVRTDCVFGAFHETAVQPKDDRIHDKTQSHQSGSIGRSAELICFFQVGFGCPRAARAERAGSGKYALVLPWGKRDKASQPHEFHAAGQERSRPPPTQLSSTLDLCWVAEQDVKQHHARIQRRAIEAPTGPAILERGGAKTLRFPLPRAWRRDGGYER